MASRWKRALSMAACGATAYFAYRQAVAWSRRYDFRGRVVVITGGSRGLGLVIARQLAAEGARLAICARDEDELATATGELHRRGADVAAYTCDLTQFNEVGEFFQLVRQELGPVDVLINNAGIIQVGPADTMTADDFRQTMAVHFWAPLRCIEQALPDMRRRGHGRIVNISSIGGKISVPHLMPYCASKFALVGLSQGLRAELAKDGVYVTTVCPGLMRTGSPRHALFKGKHRAEYAWFSISDSMPGLTIKAERAARQVIDACRYGRAEIILSIPANLAVYINALAPELTADALALAARLLPGPGGIGTQAVEGRESTSAWSPSLLTTLTEQAAEQNNQLRPS